VVYNGAVMESEDNWRRLTLRLPPDLHQKLVWIANGRSLNTTIVMLLDEAVRDRQPVGFASTGKKPEDYDEIKSALKAELRKEWMADLKDLLADLQPVDRADKPEK
jgi:hypothetical protein